MKERYFSINNSYASIYGEDNLAELSVPSVDFINHYFGFDLGILPPAVRWVSDLIPPSFILERPPHTQEISYRRVAYKIDLPWTIYGIFFEDLTTIRVHTFCRQRSIQSFDDELFVLPVPMANSEGLVEGFKYKINLSNRRLIGPSLMQVVEKMFNTRTAKNFDMEVLPLSWDGVDTSSNRKIMEHWQTYNATQAINEIEYYTSNTIPTVGALAHKLENTTSAGNTFEYLENTIKEVRELQAQG